MSGFKEIYRQAEARVARAALVEPDLVGIQVDVPEALKQIFIAEGAINRHLIPKFKNAVMSAVVLSFNHPDTAPASGVIKQQEVKRRIQTCFDAAKLAYYEMGMGLIALCDMMPHVLVDALRRHFHGDSAAPGMAQGYEEKEPDKRRWGLPQEDIVEVEVPDEAPELLAQEEDPETQAPTIEVVGG